MNKSDWKIFTETKEKALDAFCVRTLREFREIIDDDSVDPHERYLTLYKLVHKRNKEMSVLFDGHSRSNAWIQLLNIRGEGLADENLLSQLSPDFLQQTNPRKLD